MRLAYQLYSLGICISLFTLSSLQAFEEGDWLVRLRGIAVLPTGSSGSLSTISGSGVKVSNSGTAELDFTYMWTRNIGMELILATSKHTIHGKKALSGIRVGSTWVLPPTLTLQYHFLPDCNFQPYAGIGVNYSVFYSKHCSIPHTHLHLSNPWGFAAQAGFDYLLDCNWFVNFDVKYVTMDPKATLSGSTKGHVNVKINPCIIGGGIGYRF